METQLVTIYSKEEVEIPKITRQSNRQQLFWTKELLTTLITMYNEGKSYREISEIIRKTPLACRCKISRLKLIAA